MTTAMMISTTRNWTSPACRLKTPNSDTNKSGLTFVAACNGQFFGGGSKVGPQSDLFDGELDIITFTKVSQTHSISFIFPFCFPLWT